jgi:Preprotein translocase subunit SecB
MSKKKISRSSTESSLESKSNYEGFLRSVKLYSLAMEEVSAKLDRERYWKYLSDSDGLTREIGATYKAKDTKDDHFDVIAAYELRITQEQNKESLLAIKCKFSAHFHASMDCNSEMAERFANSEAKIIVWPYFRNLVSDLVGRLEIPPITIPLALD